MRANADSGDDVKEVGAYIPETSLANVIPESDVWGFVPAVGMLSQFVSVQGSRVDEFGLATLPSTHFVIRLESGVTQDWWDLRNFDEVSALREAIQMTIWAA